MVLELYPVIEYEIGKFIRNYYFRIAFIDNISKIKSTQFFKYILQHGDTPENLSMKFYGTDKYWYLILLVNNISDPFYDWKLSDVECMNYAKKYVTEKYPELTGKDRDEKISEIYTRVALKNARKEILLPSNEIIGKLHNEFITLAKTFK